jgi:hypothetical protein
LAAKFKTKIRIRMDPYWIGLLDETKAWRVCLLCWYCAQALQNVVESVITMKQLLQILQGADLETLGEEVQNMVK